MLTIHLKRFEYDMSTGNMIKVNDRFAFPRQMDIDEFLGEVCVLCVYGTIVIAGNGT